MAEGGIGATLAGLLISLGLEQKALLAGLAVADEAVAGFTKKAEGHSAEHDRAVEGMGSAWKTLGVVVAGAAVAAGVVEVAKSSIEAASTFQSATASIAASAGIQQSAADQIGKAFLSTAGTTTFSATEMATAYGGVAGRLGELMGHALSSSEALDFTRRSMDLAEASGSTLADATSNLTAAMAAFSLPLSGAAGATDDLFNASRMAAVPIGDIATAVDKMKARLGDAMPDIGSTTGLLVDLADHGLSGSRGLMQVTSALQSLEKGGTTVDAELKDLGVSLRDQQGAVLPLADVLGQLTPKLQALSPANRDAALQTLFHTDASTALGKVIMDGQAGLQAHVDRVNAMGAAHEAAEKKANTLEGAHKRLDAAIQGVAIQIGSALLPYAAQLAESLVPIATRIGDWVTANQPLINQIAGALGKGLAAVGVLLGQLLQELAPVAAGIGAWVIQNQGLIGQVGGDLFAGLQAVVTVIGFLIQHFDVLGPVLAGVAAGFIAWNVAMAVTNAMTAFMAAESGIAAVVKVLILLAQNEGIATAAQWLLNLAMDANPIGLIIIAVAALIVIIVLLVTHWDQIRPLLSKIWDHIRQVWGQAVNFVIEGVHHLVDWFKSELPKLPQQVEFAIGWIIGRFWRLNTVDIPNFLGGLAIALWEFLPTLGRWFVDIVKRFDQWNLDMLSWAIKAVPGIVSAIMNELNKLPGQVWDLGGRIIQALINGIISLAGALGPALQTVLGGVQAGASGGTIAQHSNGRLTATTSAPDVSGSTALGGGSGRGVTNNVTVHNPTPEPASTSAVRELRKLALTGLMA